MFTSFTTQSVLKSLFVLSILYIPVGIGALNPTAEIAAILGLVLATVLLPFVYRQNPVASDDVGLAVKLIFAIYFFIGMGALLLVEDSEAAVQSIGTTSHFIFFVVIYSALQRTHIPMIWLWLAIIIGAMINGLSSLYYSQNGGIILYLYDDISLKFNQRGSVNPILYGDISLVLSFASLLSWKHFSQYRWGFVLPVLGFILGLVACFYSLARGSWIAILGLIVIMIVYLLMTLNNRRHVLLSLVGLGLVIALVGLFSGDKISQRTNLAVAEFQDYFAGERYRTSIGYRLEVYKGALKVIQENPILGVGLGGEMQAINTLADRGEIRDLKGIKNVHNQFLQEGVAKGIFGIFSYLVLMGFLLIVFAKRMCASHNREVNTVGVILVVSFLIFGLTNITFTHGIFNTFFVCMVALLLSASGEGQKKALNY